MDYSNHKKPHTTESLTYIVGARCTLAIHSVPQVIGIIDVVVHVPPITDTIEWIERAAEGRVRLTTEHQKVYKLVVSR